MKEAGETQLLPTLRGACNLRHTRCSGPLRVLDTVRTGEMLRAKRSTSHFGSGAHYREVDTRQWWEKPAAMVLGVLMIAATMALLPFGPLGTKRAAGQEVQTFTRAFHADDNGAIAVFGNALETCSQTFGGGGGNCGTVQQTNFLNTSGAGGNGQNDNNNWNMVYVNVDPDGTANFNSSSATVSWPDGSTVLFAGLFWEGRMCAYAGPSPAVEHNGVVSGSPACSNPGGPDYGHPVTPLPGRAGPNEAKGADRRLPDDHGQQ